MPANPTFIRAKCSCGEIRFYPSFILLLPVMMKKVFFSSSWVLLKMMWCLYGNRERAWERICSEVCFKGDWKWTAVTQQLLSGCLINLIPARETLPEGHQTVSIYHNNELEFSFAYAPIGGACLSRRIEDRASAVCLYATCNPSRLLL